MSLTPARARILGMVVLDSILIPGFCGQPALRVLVTTCGVFWEVVSA